MLSEMQIKGMEDVGKILATDPAAQQRFQGLAEGFAAGYAVGVATVRPDDKAKQ